MSESSPTTELEIARAIVAGVLPSPTEFQNSSYYKVRVSGTGVAWRKRNQEFVYRPPSVWLSNEMCQRVAGLPVIAEHPEKLLLDGENFYDRIVGVCVLGFVEEDDLMGIVRVIDDRACEILDAKVFHTSPAVAFDPHQNLLLQVGDDRMLIEESPVLLDHLALVSTEFGNKGVWNKDGAEVGVEITKESENA